MSRLILERYCYSETETEGRLYLGDDAGTYFYTLERPWKPGMPGGMPFESCVPDGEYELVQHQRPDGSNVYALRNADLHVYYDDTERGVKPGRYLILIHAGNYVDDVVGCIAPGISRTIFNNRRMVTSSRTAMAKIMAGKWTSILIRPVLGATQ